MCTMANSDAGRKRTPAPGPAPSGADPTGRDTTPEGNVVEKLTTLAQSRTGERFYIGWGPDGRAAVTKDRRKVSAAGQELLRVYEHARNLQVPVVNYADLIPVEYSYFKLRDLASPAEDYFLLTAQDSQGQGQTYRIGELELLEGMANARTFFQDTSASGAIGQPIVPSEAVYALITPCFEFDNQHTALVILFKPAVEGAPQEATFRSFVVSVLRVLAQNDKKDEPALRKGYDEAVQSVAAPKQSQVPFLLRLVFTQEAAQEKWERLRRLLYRQPEPPVAGDTDSLSSLDTEHLLALATVMRDAARAYFARNPGARRNTNFGSRY